MIRAWYSLWYRRFSSTRARIQAAASTASNWGRPLQLQRSAAALNGRGLRTHSLHREAVRARACAPSKALKNSVRLWCLTQKLAEKLRIPIEIKRFSFAHRDDEVDKVPCPKQNGLYFISMQMRKPALKSVPNLFCDNESPTWDGQLSDTNVI